MTAGIWKGGEEEMTTEEAIEIAQKGLCRPIDEQGKKDARVAAEISLRPSLSSDVLTLSRQGL